MDGSAGIHGPEDVAAGSSGTRLGLALPLVAVASVAIVALGRAGRRSGGPGASLGCIPITYLFVALIVLLAMGAILIVST
ncbi:MAG: hypothetical protein QMD46_08710 [Methanomicrobiales archaeon]|nr:hypothetical protein [Methanomicrobiales archaeon]